MDDAATIQDPMPRADAGGGPEGGDGAPFALRGSAEVLALFLVLGAVGLMGQYLFTGLAYSEGIGSGANVSRWSYLLPLVAQGGSPVGAGLVALSLALVLFTPGPAGRWGRVALNAVSVVGVLVATLAVLGIEETLRNSAMSLNSYPDDGAAGHAQLYVQVAAVFLWLPSLAIAGYSAFTAWRALNDGLVGGDQGSELEVETDQGL